MGTGYSRDHPCRESANRKIIWKSRGRQLEMLSHPRIIIHFLYDYIQNFSAQMQICFQKLDKVIAIIRVYPNAILKTKKARLLHRLSELYADGLALLCDVKHDYAKTPVPALPL